MCGREGVVFGGVCIYSEKNHDEPDKADCSFFLNFIKVT